MISPIGGEQSEERRHANMVFEVAITPVLQAKGYSIERSDLMPNAGQITAAIFTAIRDVDLCIADLSFLNANVMYELGVRHALHKPSILIAANGTSLPFDAANERTIFFDVRDIQSLKQLSQRIAEQIDWIEDHPGEVINPLTLAWGIFESAIAAAPNDAVLSDLAARVSALESDARKPGSIIAAAITGQGDLATRNIWDVRKLWQLDQAALNLHWDEQPDGSMIADYRGFRMKVRPESKGRWSSDAFDEASNDAVPWPVWQATANDAKAMIVSAVNTRIAERDDS